MNYYPGPPSRRRSRARWGKAARKARAEERERLKGLRGQADDRGGRRAFWRRFRRHEGQPARAEARARRRQGLETARQQRRRNHGNRA